MRTLRLALFAAVFALVAPAVVTAQTLTPVLQYDIPGDGNSGANLYGSLVQASDGNLYGTAISGGTGGTGSIFRITPAGVYTDVYNCSESGADCNLPIALIEGPDGNLYGASGQGGAYLFGNIFELTLPGLQFSDLHDFDNDSSGAYPNANIIFANTDLGLAIIGTNSGTQSESDPAGFGNIWQYAPDFGVGFSVFSNLLTLSETGSIGNTPIAGVTMVGGTIYAASQGGGANGCGAIYSLNEGKTNLLYTFTCAADGAYPDGSPKYYSDGFLYGTTLGGADGNYHGSVWKQGLTANSFTTLYTFNTTSVINPNFTASFDTAGNILFTAGKGGTNGVGGLYAEPRSGGAVKTLYSFATGSTYGDQPYSQPFFDATGDMWSLQLGGGSGMLGTIDKWTLSTETKAPITISASPATVAPKANSTISWSTNNSFSDNEKMCFGSGNSNTSWSGAYQTGTYSGGVYSGSFVANFSTAGNYVFTITCGGTESASVTLTVGSAAVATTTALTATPNPVGQGQNITLSATVKKSSGSGTPTGEVTFKSGSTVLDTVSLNGSGVASVTAPTTAYPNGTYPVVAAYAGDTNDNASTSSAVNVVIKDATTTALVITPTTVTIPANVTLKATVSASKGGTPTGTVTFMEGTYVLGTVNVSGGVGSATVSSGSYPAGTYEINAVYNGDTAQAPSTSSTVKVVVNK
jgi:uncharacterized repeat protein (TIGR03803 family)